MSSETKQCTGCGATVTQEINGDLRDVSGSRFCPKPVGCVSVHTVSLPPVAIKQEDALTPLEQELLAALKAANTLLNHMGDILNGMDAVTPEDQEMAAPIFEQVRAAIAKAEAVQA